MAVRRFVPSEIGGFRGSIVYQFLVAQSSTPAVGASSYYELDSSAIFSQYKCGLVFINITAIAGTWTIRLVTSLRLSSTAPPHRHILQNQLSVVGRTTTGQIEVGWNAYSGANTLLAEKMELEFAKTAGLAGDTVTVNADAVFYN